MLIELTKTGEKIMCKVGDQEETTLGELGLGIMLASAKQLKKVFGEAKPEWKLHFQPNEEEEKGIESLKAALDKVYSE